MTLSKAVAAAVFSGLTFITVSAQQRSPAGRPWPPGVQKVSPDSPVLSPAEELKTFYMPPGYHVELVASEPLIEAPVALDWDLHGRLWVVEMPGFMANLTGSNEHDPIGRVVVLEDANHDGVMDKRTIFVDHMVLVRSIKVLDRGVLLAEPPNVWFMRDTNGDLKADEKQLVTSEFGNFNGDPQNNANGFYWAMDNRMYTAGVTEIQFRLKDGVFEIQRTLERGEWGVAQDDAGRIYRNTNESAVHVDYVPSYYYARNPNLLRTRGSYERLSDDDANVVWPVRPNPGTNRAYQLGIDRPDGTLNRYTAVCAPLIYRGDRLPPDLYGNAFVAEAAANLVGRLVIEDTGAGLRARRAYDEKGEFLASTDERFRPVFITDAPDGTMYIADMYRGIIEHRISITEYLRDQILSRKLDQGTGYGRIYRVMNESTKRDSSDPFASATPQQLVQALSSPNGWRRDTAQRLLVERGARAVAPALVQLASVAKDWRTRLHALWTLDGLDAIDVPTVQKALDDGSRDVRVSAIRIAERWLADANSPIQSAVLARIEDTDWQVRQQLAASLGVLPQEAREAALIRLLERSADDPVVMDAALSSLRGREGVVLDKLMNGR
jgi:putative membrane-bound dehydrogenase-like protein